uniref:Solute carrier family 25 member 3 n=1 Tax=Cyprinus carpio TaxID=7962 RepID=A0A8C1SEU7_CYPCA
MQNVDPAKYKSIFNGFSVTIREDGVRGLAKGWAPTFIGYSMQGLCKFGFYEVFKILYGDLLGEVTGVFCAIVSHPADSVVSIHLWGVPPLRFCRALSLGAAGSGRRLPAASRLYSWRCLSHWRVRSVYLLTQNPLCPEPSQENTRAEQLESRQTMIKSVWKGLVARIIMIGTLTALQWFIYDSVKVYFRLPRPPPPEMPESLKKKLGLTE